MKEKVLETLHELGFKTEEMEALGYCFSYEGYKYLYMPVENDDSFVSISLPNIAEIDEDNQMLYGKLTDRINSTVKYVKAYTYDNGIWLSYEREIIGEEVLADVIPNMIIHLTAALYFAKKEESALFNNGDDDCDADDCESNDEEYVITD